MLQGIQSYLFTFWTQELLPNLELLITSYRTCLTKERVVETPKVTYRIKKNLQVHLVLYIYRLFGPQVHFSINIILLFHHLPPNLWVLLLPHTRSSAQFSSTMPHTNDTLTSVPATDDDYESPAARQTQARYRTCHSWNSSSLRARKRN